MTGTAYLGAFIKHAEVPFSHQVGHKEAPRMTATSAVRSRGLYSRWAATIRENSFIMESSTRLPTDQIQGRAVSN